MSIKGVCCLCLLLLGIGFEGVAQDSLRVYRRLDSIRQLPDDTGKVALLIKKGKSNARYFDSSGTENLFWQEAVRVSQLLKYPRGLSLAYNELGTNKRNKSQYIIAADYHEKAIRQAEETNDTVLLAFALNNAGVDNRRMDKLQQAFDYHLRALALAESIHDTRNICVATNSIGNIQLTTENYGEAITHFNRALQLEEDSKNQLGVAINLANLGYAWQGLHQEERAIQYFKQSLAVNQKIDNPTGMAICYNALGAAYKEVKDYGTAMEYLEKALVVNDKVEDKVHVAESYLNIGKLLGAQGRHEAARQYIQRSIEVSTYWNFKSMLMEAYKALAVDYKSSGDFRKSLEATEKSLLYKDSIVDEKSAMVLAQMQAIYEVDRKNMQIRNLEHDKMVNLLRTKRNVVITITLGAFLLMAIVGGFFYIRHRNLEANKQTLQLELRSLRSQMNPHFIFNSLSSIHRYIWSNSQEEASDYLTKFSRLMRLILDNTQHTFVTLNKELESLRLYLDLESLRCNGIFEFAIRVSPDINEEEVLIPPMILQPYVENAIWHGLVHKQAGQGALDISIVLKKRSLVCTVTDNGIGRKKAMAIKERKGRVHTSVGMKVTEGRIDLIRKINNKEANVQVQDLEDEAGQPLGTSVVITLPAEFIF
ncbi:tetratricopeptide repeat-containing sensor histidine kinase [Chitinophaga nivalis]|uniref:Tetratricopeptide repeat protein n=1 Tax=Chitinophaga nivalis TaxID=2991709 RepID=A0ABT3IS14_9BACT|nr:tetratricopeptide repeat protein [Chitinophaga nivalis]MCW3463552.1 tetratricopeptide repeat protein [Chitinophaga nivalis]MCW3486758.1 tetratricopeptide repeat protein [Chitinophaga nivalis]